IVQVENERYQSELISFFKKVEHFSFPVEVINVYEEIAKRFWQSHKAILENDSRLNFLLVGYGRLGKQIVNGALYFASNDKLNFTVLDHFEKEEKSGSIELIPFNIEVDSLRSFIAKRKDDYSHI